MKTQFALWTALFYATSVHAQTPTIVYGASETAPNEPDSYLLEQPDNAPNPLGNPIPEFMPQNQESATNIAGPENTPKTSASEPQIEGEINQTITEPNVDPTITTYPEY